MDSIKQHWNKVYKSKSSGDYSWYQKIPKTSLEFFHGFNLPKTASIIDVGAGESNFVDYLLSEGYTNISVLDISEEALSIVKKRLGKDSEKVKWIVSDITEFNSDINYDLWHDRATFHFLTTPLEIQKYVSLAKLCVNKFMLIGTFSDKGPDKCSGLEVHKYSEEELDAQLNRGFEKIKCITEDHITPFNSIQNFLFCSFKRKLN